MIVGQRIPPASGWWNRAHFVRIYWRSNMKIKTNIRAGLRVGVCPRQSGTALA
jgi:hypothetical protein